MCVCWTAARPGVWTAQGVENHTTAKMPKVVERVNVQLEFETGGAY